MNFYSSNFVGWDILNGSSCKTHGVVPTWHILSLGCVCLYGTPGLWRLRCPVGPRVVSGVKYNNFWSVVKFSKNKILDDGTRNIAVRKEKFPKHKDEREDYVP